MEEDLRRLNITEDMVYDRQQWRRLITSDPSCGTRWTLNEDDDDGDVGGYDPRPAGT